MLQFRIVLMHNNDHLIDKNISCNERPIRRGNNYKISRMSNYTHRVFLWCRDSIVNRLSPGLEYTRDCKFENYNCKNIFVLFVLVCFHTIFQLQQQQTHHNKKSLNSSLQNYFVLFRVFDIKKNHQKCCNSCLLPFTALKNNE